MKILKVGGTKEFIELHNTYSPHELMRVLINFFSPRELTMKSLSPRIIFPVVSILPGTWIPHMKYLTYKFVKVIDIGEPLAVYRFVNST